MAFETVQTGKRLSSCPKTSTALIWETCALKQVIVISVNTFNEELHSFITGLLLQS